MTLPTLGLAVIARDEEANLPHLLALVEGAFDQVALLDTGSRDGTVATFRAWADGTTLPLGAKVEEFAWCDDFAAARNAADALLGTDWIAYADADDLIDGAQVLRSFIQQAPPACKALAFRYGYFPGAPPEADLIYTRLVRRDGAPPWVGRVHEERVFGAYERHVCQRPVPRWLHRCESLAAHRERNFRILRAWIGDEPDNQVPLGLLAHEHLLDGDRPMLVRQARQFVGSFGDRMTAEQRACATWAVDGIEAAVDTTAGLPADHLLQLAIGFAISMTNQAMAGAPLAAVQQGGDAVAAR